tara:strand:+ start:1332 stop:1577 length:246 start_codon:yes stop_codon:yes gene_type:complete
VPKDGRKLKPKYRNMKTLIERYCEAVETTGKEITIQLKDGLTEKLYNKVKAVANRYDIACHAGSYDILLKPSVKYIDGRKL